MTSDDKTTIKLSKRTKERLDKLKEYPHETYEEILIKMFEVINAVKTNSQQAISRLNAIDKKRNQN